MNPRVSLSAIIAASIIIAAQTANAGSATWDLNPTSNDWNTAANWTPATIPSATTDVAIFGVSNVTNVMCGDAPGLGGVTTVVGAIIFQSGASPYTITATPVFDIVYPTILEIYGKITNSSSVTQNFVAANSGTSKGSAHIYFEGNASGWRQRNHH